MQWSRLVHLWSSKEATGDEKKMGEKKNLQELGWATTHSQAWSRYSRLYRDTVGMGAQGMGHDMARARPRHGLACTTIWRAVRAIRPSACAGWPS